MYFRDFSPKQQLSMTWWTNESLSRLEGIICDGAIRSGKTLSLSVGFLLWSMGRFQGESFALCGKTVESLRRNVVLPLIGWVDGAFTITERRSENKLIVTRPDGRANTYYLFGGRDESSYALIQGITLAGVLLDEAALMPKSFVEQACARCSVEGSKLWFNCNPAGPEHWFYTDWIGRSRERGLLHLHFTMADNPALPEEIRRRYERMYTGVFYRRYILGEWCQAEGLVYPYDPEEWVTGDIPTRGRYFISVDYGTLNPFSAGLWCLSGGTAYRVREYYYDGRKTGAQRTDEEYYAALRELAGDCPVECVVVDPSAASFITLIRRRREFRVRKAVNDVVNGIRLTAGYLTGGQVKLSPLCKDALREFRLYQWEEDSTQDRPRKENDHAMDEIRYFCATILRRELTE